MDLNIEQKIQDAVSKVEASVKREVLIEVHKVLLRNELAALIQLEPNNAAWAGMLKMAGNQ